jgi:hypothetical protein
MDLLDDFARFSRWARFDALAWLRQHNWDWDEAMVAHMWCTLRAPSALAVGCWRLEAPSQRIPTARRLMKAYQNHKLKSARGIANKIQVGLDHRHRLGCRRRQRPATRMILPGRGGRSHRARVCGAWPIGRCPSAGAALQSLRCTPPRRCRSNPQTPPWRSCSGLFDGEIAM